MSANTRPKILTRFTIPTGGWDLRLSITNTLQFDTNVDITLTAGDYYVAFDGQDDDFIQEIHLRAYNGLVASGITGYNTTDTVGKPHFSALSTGQVVIQMLSAAELRIDWSFGDGAEVGKVLGISTTFPLDLIASGYSKTGNWQHAYGWYAEEIGQLAAYGVDDNAEALTLQARAVSGKHKFYHVETYYNNAVSLQFLTRTNTWSGGVRYADTNTFPYERNQGLECWFHEAVRGAPFRVYTNSAQNITAPLGNFEAFTQNLGDTLTTVTTSATWDGDPKELVGKILYIPGWAGTVNEVDTRYYITNNAGAVITVVNSLHNTDVGGDLANTDVYVIDQRYKTYVLDTARFRGFSPRERRTLDRYDISIPMQRFV